MLSFDNAINILKELPYELVEHTVGYLSSIDMVNFINKTDVPININLINSSKEELIIFNLLEDDNKLFKWCKILYNADCSKYYKTKYKEERICNLKLPTGADNKYIFKLKMGLFLNISNDYRDSYKYSKLDFDKISIIYKTFKDYPNEFEIWYLLDIIKVLKNKYDYDIYIKIAKRIKQIRSMGRYCENSDFKTLNALSAENYQRIINIITGGATFQTALLLSKNINKYSDELIEKFIQLKKELCYDDNIILSFLKNDKMINHLKLFKKKGFSRLIINYLLRLELPIIDYLVNNNYFDKLKNTTFEELNNLNVKNNDLIKQFFNKFTIKQQNNLRMKQLMEHEDYDKLLISYIEANINNVYNCLCNQYTNKTNYSISVEQYFNAYTELTEIQFKTFLEKIAIGTNYDTALAEAYQITVWCQSKPKVFDPLGLKIYTSTLMKSS